MSFELREFPVPSFPRLTHFGYCSSEGGHRFAAHRHLGYEFLYIESGSADVRLEPGAEAVRLESHDCVLTPPGVEHCFEVPDCGMSYFWAGVQTDEVVRTSDSNLIPPRSLLGRRAVRVEAQGPDRSYADLRRLAGSLELSETRILRRAPELGPVFRSMESEITAPEGTSAYLVYAKVLELFALYGKKLGEGAPGRRPSPLVRSVMAHIAASLQSPLPNPALAVYAGVSVRQLQRLFRDELGTSPSAYVERLRIEEACRLLAAGYRPVDIPRRTGFGSAEHFHRRFRRAMGMTPNRYRAVHGGPGAHSG